jgi:hypothetical protein
VFKNSKLSAEALRVLTDSAGHKSHVEELELDASLDF